MRAINVEPADCPHLADGGAQAADGGREAEPAADIPPKAKKATNGRDGAKGPIKQRAGTKQARLIAMLKTPEGGSLTVTSEKVEDRGRVYRIAG